MRDHAAYSHAAYSRVDFQDGSELHFAWGSWVVDDGRDVLLTLRPFPGFVPGPHHILMAQVVDRNGVPGNWQDIHSNIAITIHEYREIAEEEVDALDAIKAIQRVICGEI